MAHIQPFSVLQSLSNYFSGNTSTNNTAMSATSGVYEDGHFHPSPVDILITRLLLTQGRRIPIPVVDTILDYAEYWARSSTENNYKTSQGSHLRVTAKPQGEEDLFLLRSPPVGITEMPHHRQDTNPGADHHARKPSARRITRECDPQVFHRCAKYPTPSLAWPARKIVFRMRSKDQGWGVRKGNGTYSTSWTWFEAGLERYEGKGEPEGEQDGEEGSESLEGYSLRTLQPELEEIPEGERGTHEGDGIEGENVEADNAGADTLRLSHPLMPQPKWEIQRNRTANREFMDHVVTWHWTDDILPDSDAGQALDEQGRGRETGTGEFVRGLKMGDVVTVWAKARFQGWVNIVESVRVDVYWAV